MVEPGPLEVAVVIGAHGVRGTLKVLLHRPESQAIVTGGEYLLLAPEGSGEAGARCSVTMVNPIPGKTGQLRVELGGFQSRDQAEKLRGWRLAVDRGALPSLAEDEFYLADAMGLPVIRTGDDGLAQSLGTIVAVTSNGAQELFEVRWEDGGGQGHTWLLPVVPACIREVTKEHVRVDLPLGMLPAELERPAEDDAGPGRP